jgi:hypothetical protein
MRVQNPLARTDELVVEEVADEVLVYDQRNDQAHCLSSDAGTVWRACDGKTSVSGLSAKLGMDEATVSRAMDELEQCGLLDSGPKSAGITRREATARMAKVGAAAASAPLIYSIMAPTPALAASQAFCLSFGCINTGCGACHNCGCACCGPGNSGGVGVNKLCTADCTSVNCTIALLESHCDVAAGTAFSCNTGGGMGKCQLTPVS